MKKPPIIDKLTEEYGYIVESSKKFDQEYNYTLEEHIRKEYDDLIHRVPNNRSGVFGQNPPSYATIKEYEEAVAYLDSKQKTNDQETKQGTARQLALAFHFMVLAKDLPKGTLDNTKNAEFMEFLTGKDYENIRKKLGSIKNGEISGITTEKGIKSLINDLKATRNIFDKILFVKEVRLINAYIEKLQNDLSSMEE